MAFLGRREAIDGLAWPSYPAVTGRYAFRVRNSLGNGQ